MSCAEYQAKISSLDSRSCPDPSLPAVSVVLHRYIRLLARDEVRDSRGEGYNHAVASHAVRRLHTAGRSRKGLPRRGEATLGTYHTQQPRSSMFHLKVLVVECPAVYAERARSVVVEEVAALDHELRNARVSRDYGMRFRQLTLYTLALGLEQTGVGGAHRWNVAFL